MLWLLLWPFALPRARPALEDEDDEDDEGEGEGEGEGEVENEGTEEEETEDAAAAAAVAAAAVAVDEEEEGEEGGEGEEDEEGEEEEEGILRLLVALLVALPILPFPTLSEDRGPGARSSLKMLLRLRPLCGGGSCPAGLLEVPEDEALVPPLGSPLVPPLVAPLVAPLPPFAPCLAPFAPLASFVPFGRPRFAPLAAPLVARLVNDDERDETAAAAATSESESDPESSSSCCCSAEAAACLLGTSPPWRLRHASTWRSITVAAHAAGNLSEQMGQVRAAAVARAVWRRRHRSTCRFRLLLSVVVNAWHIGHDSRVEAIGVLTTSNRPALLSPFAGTTAGVFDAALVVVGGWAGASCGGDSFCHCGC